MLHLFLLVCYCTVYAVACVSDTTSAAVRITNLLASLLSLASLLLLVSLMLLIPRSRQYTAGRPNAAIPALVLLLHAVNLDKVWFCCSLPLLVYLHSVWQVDALPLCWLVGKLGIGS